MPAACRTAANIPYTAPAGRRSRFYYDHRTKNIQNTAQGDLVAAAGSFQSELGCPTRSASRGLGTGLHARLVG